MGSLGREQILAAIRYREVACPDAGSVSVFDYISAGAMGEFATHRSNPSAALAAVIRSSLEDSDATFQRLTPNDYAAIARHLVKVTGVDEVFDAELKKSNLAKAFVHAIEQSDHWKSHVKSEERMRASFEKWLRPYNSVVREIELQRSLVLDVTKHAHFVRGLKIKTIAEPRLPLIELKSFASIAIGANRTAQEFSRIHDNARAQLETWDRIAAQVAHRADLVTSMSIRHQELNLMVNRLSTIKPIVAPIADLYSTFAEVAAQIQSGRSLANDVLVKTNTGLAKSLATTLKANDFFANVRPPIAFAVESSLPEQALEPDQEIRSAYEEGETILHEKTALVIAEGTTVVENIRLAVGSEIDRRLGKYTSILERLENLSKPPTFLEFLKEFSLIAAREYWSTLWVDPGNKWQSRPERHAQAMLGMYLHGKWSGVAFVGREIASGDGYVDLLVHFMGHDYIVELKMIGAGWAISHAESGLTQLEQYMASYDASEAYLVVFDGRKTSSGRQLPNTHETSNGIVHVVSIPAYFEAPSGL